MDDRKKGRRTTRRTERLAERRSRGVALGGWLQDQLAQAQKRASVARKAKATKTPDAEADHREPEWVIKHSFPSRGMRRSGQGRGNLRNKSFVNPARDLRPGRRLRTPQVKAE